MNAPDPTDGWSALEKMFDRGEVVWLAPRKFQRVESQSHPFSVVGETVAEFAVADDKAGLVFQRKLRGDGVVSERAGAEKNLDVLGIDQFAQALLQLLQLPP